MSKNVLVTGSSSGIGAGIVRELSNEDYIDGIGIHYNKNINDAIELQKDISISNKQVEIFKSDFSLGSSDLVSKFIEKFGSLDILVNCAGIVSSTSFDELTNDEYDRVMNINLKTAFFIAKDAFNHMKDSGGKIINISSITSKFGVGRNKSIHYAISKAGLDTLTIGLARIGAEYNILVNSVSAGVIDTRIHNDRIDREERKNFIPLKRFGTVKDIATMVNYLVSNQGNFITGQIIRVTGGE